MYVCVKVSHPLALELQTVVSCHVDLNMGPLEEQPVLLTMEPSLQPQEVIFKQRKKVGLFTSFSYHYYPF